MDELEISGKRYISTRRAAKEYKYHSDYIGQLIRGKKLLGRKVGRSWYVELESLKTYFGKEAAGVGPSETVAKAVEEVRAEPKVVQAVEVKKTPTIEIAAEPEKLVEVRVEREIVAAQPVEIKVAPKVFREEVAEESFVERNNVEIKEVARDAIHIPIRVRRPSFETPEVKRAPTLTYVSDDEPYIPLSRREQNEIQPMVVMPRTQEEAEEIFEENNYVEERNSNPLFSVFGVAALGVLVLMVIVGASVLVSSHTVIEAGKAASVDYTLQ